MGNFDLRDIPTVVFAHKFAANEYHGRIPDQKNMIEVTIVTEGELFVEQSGKRYLAKKGDIICNRYCDKLFVDAAKYHSHHTVCFEMDHRVLTFVPPLLTSVSEISSSCLYLIDKIIQTRFLDPENSLKLFGLFIQLLGELEFINREDTLHSSPAEHRYVEKTKKYIFEHIAEPISQKDISEWLGITPEYLCFVFKKVEGRSVIRFINETKLTHIKLMMANRQLSLSQASLQYGFSDPNYVSKLYKKYYRETITQAVKSSNWARMGDNL